MSRGLLVSLALVATGLLLAGALTVSWWTYESGEWSASMGLRESRFCNPETCHAAPVGQGEDAQWVRAGEAAYAAAWVGAGLLLALVVVLLLRRRPDLLVKTALVAGVCALGSGVLYAIMAPSYPGMSTGYSLYLYLVGSALSIVAAVAVLRAQPDEA